MSESILNKDAKELDRCLQEKCGYSLWHFSFSLAMNYSPLSWIDYREGGKIKLLKKGKKNGEKLSKIYRNPPFVYESYKLIEEAIKKNDEILNSQNTKGRPAERINIIALAWSYFIDSPVEIIELLAWFKERFKNTIGYKPICDGVDKISKESFRKLLHRHKTGGIHKAWVEECKDSFKAIPGAMAIPFEDKRFKGKWIKRSERHKDTALVTFPDGEILTVGDFEENNKSEPSSYWP